MAVADRSGLPVSIYIESATPHEVTLVKTTLAEMVISDAPANLVGDNAYDSDKLDTDLRQYGIEVIAPHRSNRKNKTQDGRRLRRYRRRWKIERLFAWLQNFRRLVIHYERYAENFLGMATLVAVLSCCDVYEMGSSLPSVWILMAGRVGVSIGDSDRTPEGGIFHYQSAAGAASWPGEVSLLDMDLLRCPAVCLQVDHDKSPGRNSFL